MLLNYKKYFFTCEACILVFSMISSMREFFVSLETTSSNLPRQRGHIYKIITTYF